MNMKHLIVSAALAISPALTNAAIAAPTAAKAVSINADFTSAGDINPKSFTVGVGQKVRFQVNPKESGTGCMSDIMVQGLWNRPQLLVKGKPVVMEFTPARPGTYRITCGMGVDRGFIRVN